MSTKYYKNKNNNNVYKYDGRVMSIYKMGKWLHVFTGFQWIINNSDHWINITKKEAFLRILYDE